MKKFFKKAVNVIKNNLVKTTLIVVLNVGFVALCLGVSSYAWIIARANLSTINVDSGSLKINSITTTVYKYVFGTTSGLVDYTTGTYTSETLTTTAIEMNLFDPVSIYIQDPTDAEIKTLSSKMNSNIVLKIDLALDVECDYALKLDALKNSNTNPDTTTYTDGIADYITICGADSTSFNTLSGSSSDEDVFKAVKTYGESSSTTLHSFHDGENLITSTNIIDALNKDSTDTTVSLYLNIDYSYNYIKKYVNEDLYTPKKFYMNYGFNVRADQRFE